MPITRHALTLGSAAALIVGACTPTAVAPAAVAPAATTTCGEPATTAPRDAGALDATQAPHVPRLHLLLRPRPEPKPHLEVEVEYEGVEAGAWSVAAPAARSTPVFSDAAGPLAMTASVAPGGATTWTPSRPESGAVRARYDVTGAAALDEPAAPALAEDYMRVSGESTLLLPVSLDARQVEVTLEIDATAIAAIGAASSLGVGERRVVKVTGATLRHSTFVAGQVGTAVFRSSDGTDDAAWLGVTAFDPRAAAAEIAQARTALHGFFGDLGDRSMHTLLFVTHARPIGSFSTLARSSSTLVHLGGGERWGAPLRLSVTQQLVHRWIGGQLWIGATDAEHEAESYWFTEGMARHYAANLLFRFGLLEPEEYRDEIAGAVAEVVASPLRDAANSVLAKRITAPGTLPLVVARSMLYAIRLDAVLRGRSKGGRGIDSVVLALLREARETKKALPLSAWIDAIAREAGPDEVRAFERAVFDGALAAIPKGALGPCFRDERARYGRWDLGFDAPPPTVAPPFAVRGLRADGPAARAGVRASDRIVSLDMRAGRADRPVHVDVERSGKRVSIEYLPLTDPHPGPGWARVKDVPVEQCAR